MPVKKSKEQVGEFPTDIVKEEGLALLAIKYDNLKTAEKELKKEMTITREPLEEAVKSADPLPSGSKQMNLAYAGKEIVLKHTLRNGKSLTSDAVQILEDAGLDECVEKSPYVLVERVEAMFNAGRIPLEVMERVFRPTEGWAFSVSVKDKKK